MTRRMMQPDDDNFRVVVRRKQEVRNPRYERGNGEPLYVFTGEEYDSYYGPYPKIGTARGVQAHEAYKPAYLTEDEKPRSELAWGVVDTWLEKVAEIVWERVPE